jgi:hypothetical protein
MTVVNLYSPGRTNNPPRASGRQESSPLSQVQRNRTTGHVTRLLNPTWTTKERKTERRGLQVSVVDSQETTNDRKLSSLEARDFKDKSVFQEPETWKMHQTVARYIFTVSDEPASATSSWQDNYNNHLYTSLHIKRARMSESGDVNSSSSNVRC